MSQGPSDLAAPSSFPIAPHAKESEAIDATDHLGRLAVSYIAAVAGPASARVFANRLREVESPAHGTLGEHVIEQLRAENAELKKENTDASHWILRLRSEIDVLKAKLEPTGRD